MEITPTLEKAVDVAVGRAVVEVAARGPQGLEPSIFTPPQVSSSVHADGYTIEVAFYDLDAYLVSLHLGAH